MQYDGVDVVVFSGHEVVFLRYGCGRSGYCRSFLKIGSWKERLIIMNLQTRTVDLSL